MVTCRRLALPVLLLPLITAGPLPSIPAAAARYVPRVTWQPKSLVTADFTCRGPKQQAILGTNTEEIVIAVFLNGANKPPEVLRYSANVREAADAILSIEDSDFDPLTDLGYALPGFRRSKSCKGLNLSDGRIDSAHIYWNHDAQRFDDWSL